MKRRSYVNDALVHWTGRGTTDEEAFGVLRTICTEMLFRLSHCPSYVQPDFKKQAAMVCFTDIPLRHSREHCKKFGRVGIGFRKANLIRYGANPVLYTTGVHFERIKHVTALLERMKDREKDREWREEMEPYAFTEDETVALLEVSEFLQEYSYKNNDDSDYVTYYQREWRLPFSSLPFAGQGKSQEAGMSGFYIRDEKRYETFKFSSADVEFIVVPLRYWYAGLALGRALKCKVKLYELAVCVQPFH